MLPSGLRPMLATPGDLPEGESWAYEPKWDGFRALAFVENGRTCLRSRAGRDVTGDYPEVSLDLPDAVVDGELVVLADGVPSFNALQRHLEPVTFVPFDVLHLRDRSLLDLPYDERRAVLQDLLPGTPPGFHGDGRAFLEATLAQGLEGVVAKRRDSRYLPGRRSDCWVKVKHVRHQAAVVGGWKEGQGRRARGIGSLLLGVPSPAGLQYVGNVGTGFTGADLEAFAELLGPLARESAPFVDPPRPAAHWVEPAVVVEVVFTEWTPDGRLRHPSYRGVRRDLRPEDVVRE